MLDFRLGMGIALLTLANAQFRDRQEKCNMDATSIHTDATEVPEGATEHHEDATEEAKPLFSKLLHGPKVARILAATCEQLGADSGDAKAIFEALWLEDSGRVRTARELNPEDIQALRAFVADPSRRNREAAMAQIECKSEATLNSLVVKNAALILS